MSTSRAAHRHTLRLVCYGTRSSSKGLFSRGTRSDGSISSRLRLARSVPFPSRLTYPASVPSMLHLGLLPKLLCSVDARCISQARAKILEELMKRGVVVLFCGLLIRISDVAVASWLSLPSIDEAKALLNSTHHHP